MAGFVEVDLGADLETAEVLPISDVHVGDPAFREEAFSNLLKWVLEARNRFVLLGGDLANVSTRSAVSDIYASRMSPAEEIAYITKKLRPLADEKRLLVSVEGNHEHRITKQDGIDPAEVIANNLGVPYHREGAVLFIRLGKAVRSSGRHDGEKLGYLVYLTHGSAGGRKPGSKANMLESMSLNMEGVDAIVVGHTHQVLAMRNEVCIPDIHNKRMLTRDRVYVNAGSFLGWGGYAESAAFTPGSSVMPVLILDGSRKNIQVRL